MHIRNLTRTAALLALVAFVISAIAACGGGGDDSTTPVIPKVQDLGGKPPVFDDFDSQQYGGKQQPDVVGGIPDDPVTPQTPTTEPNFQFGNNIFNVPLDSNGVGRVRISDFGPTDKVALVAVNLNRQYLDANVGSDGVFPVLPTSAYTVSADTLNKGGASASADSGMETTSENANLTLADFGNYSDYKGMGADGSVDHPYGIYEREARAKGEVPFSANPPVKSASTIQKGELRSFPLVEPTIPPPPVTPGEEDPDEDVSDLMYPFEYTNSQDGRVVAIGSHCLIFLSTEINNGSPDTIRFTEARLNRLAKEFDTVIYPTLTTAFGPVRSYDDPNVLRDLDRSIRLTADDFNEQGDLVTELPASSDTGLAQEEKVVIFLFNRTGGGSSNFFAFGVSPEAQELLIEQGREDEIESFSDIGNVLYIDSNNFPANDDGWTAAYSVIAHEFQHKLHHDNDVTDSRGPHSWFNEGMSRLAIHVAGYTVNSGQIVPWAIDGQVTDYLNAPYASAVPMDGNDFFSVQTQYGNSFLFFLYLYEHYEAGLGKRIYDASANGEKNRIRLIEQATGEAFENTYAKWAIANFVDGLFTDDQNLFDPRFRYNTIDLRGTIDLWNGQIVLPGVATSTFPGEGTYPVTSIHRPCIPWGCDYVAFGNGDLNTDLEITLFSDPNFKYFLLPAEFDNATGNVSVTPDVVIPD